jgi:hypothetical protein
MLVKTTKSRAQIRNSFLEIVVDTAKQMDMERPIGFTLGQMRHAKAPSPPTYRKRPKTEQTSYWTQFWAANNHFTITTTMLNTITHSITKTVLKLSNKWGDNRPDRPDPTKHKLEFNEYERNNHGRSLFIESTRQLTNEVNVRAPLEIIGGSRSCWHLYDDGHQPSRVEACSLHGYGGISVSKLSNLHPIIKQKTFQPAHFGMDVR